LVLGVEHEGIEPLSNPIDLVTFFMIIVVVEHVILISKMLLEMIIDDVPSSSVTGERER
jgi:hypothetical protein